MNSLVYVGPTPHVGNTSQGSLVVEEKVDSFLCSEIYGVLKPEEPSPKRGHKISILNGFMQPINTFNAQAKFQ